MENEKLVYICMENSYNLITGKKSIEYILENSNYPYFLWNIIGDEVEDELFEEYVDLIIDHYEHYEDYEKCAELLNIKNYGKKTRNKYKRKIKQASTIWE
tara:strand:+ start:983 stop:1282 length:300 start_codon:yes stop_codon:yes gene_type:complete